MTDLPKLADTRDGTKKRATLLAYVVRRVLAACEEVTGDVGSAGELAISELTCVAEASEANLDEMKSLLEKLQAGLTEAEKWAAAVPTLGPNDAFAKTMSSFVDEGQLRLLAASDLQVSLSLSLCLLSSVCLPQLTQGHDACLHQATVVSDYDNLLLFAGCPRAHVYPANASDAKARLACAELFGAVKVLAQELRFQSKEAAGRGRRR